MKKTAIIAGAAFLLLTATVNAQQPDSTKQPMTAPQTTMPATTESAMPPANTTTTSTLNDVTTSTGSLPYGTDKWNNWDSKTKYAMLPMPEPLTIEKIFPVIGKYDVTDKDGNHSTVNITLDENNKGIAWVDGLPQGKTEIYLRQSPAVYKIPAQKSEDGKEIAQGVLIYDKDANTLNVCSNCTYNNDDPATVFSPEQQVTEEQPVAKTKSKKTKVKKEVKPKPVFYTGIKEMQEEQQETAPAETTTPATMPAPQQ